MGEIGLCRVLLDSVMCSKTVFQYAHWQMQSQSDSNCKCAVARVEMHVMWPDTRARPQTRTDWIFVQLLCKAHEAKEAG